MTNKHEDLASTTPANAVEGSTQGAVPSATLDRVAIMLSGVCLVHCLAVPFALLLGPFLGGWLAETETTMHWVLLALAAPVSLAALTRGSRTNLGIGIAGLGLMFVGVSHLAGVVLEVALTTIGVLLLIVAHARNLLGQHRHD